MPEAVREQTEPALGATCQRSPRRRRHWGLAAYTTAVFVFLYFPIVVLVVYSFNGAGVGGFPPHDLTLDWYRVLAGDGSMWQSVGNSFLVALVATAFSLVLGLVAALALQRAHFPGKRVFRRLVLLPLILPGIITGLSLLILFVSAGVDLSLLTVGIGHCCFLLAVAVTELYGALIRLNPAHQEASLDLGATPWQTFLRVVLPEMKIPLIAAGLLMFTLSMDEIAVTFFLVGRQNTLPLEIWSRLRRGMTPEINAISTLIFLFSLILILAWYRLRGASTDTLTA